MTDDANKQDRRLARLLEEGGQEDPKEHPAPEKLSAYQAGELPLEEADAIQEHLVWCTFCADLLLDLESSLEPEEESEEREGVANLGVETGWRKVQAGMGWTGEGKDDPSGEASRLKKALRRLRMLAAVLLVGMLGLSVYAWRLWQELNTTDAPVSASPANQLGARSGPKEDAEILVVSPGDSIVFTLSDLRDSSGEYGVEIYDSEGKTLWSRSGLKMREDYLAFRVHPDILKPGLYTIRVFTKDHSPVGEYFVKIVLPL